MLKGNVFTLLCIFGARRILYVMSMERPGRTMSALGLLVGLGVGKMVGLPFTFTVRLLGNVSFCTVRS